MEMCYKNNDNHVSGTSKLSQITATYRFKVQIKLSLLMINGDKVNIGSPNKKITIGAQNFFRTIRTEDSSFGSGPSQISINFLNL